VTKEEKRKGAKSKRGRAELKKKRGGGRSPKGKTALPKREDGKRREGKTTKTGESYENLGKNETRPSKQENKK